jgi:hypothetical protein
MLLAHLPCCGLPAMIGLGSLSSGAGWLTALNEWRPWLLGFSLLMAGLTVFAAFKPVQATCGCCRVKIETWKKCAAAALAVIALISAGIQLPSLVSEEPGQVDHTGHNH